MIAQFGFDTLAFSKKLAAAGMETPQAEALTEAMTAFAFSELVTKTDLRAELKELELRLTIRMGVMFGATIAILGTLIALH
jgi:hypothetical protein